MKLYSICPNCFSTRIHVRLGSHAYKEGGVLKIPDDFGEVFECPDCSFEGIDVFDGNSAFVYALKEKRKTPLVCFDSRKEEKVETTALVAVEVVKVQ